MNTAFKLAMAAFYFWIFCIAFNGLVKAAPTLQVIYQNDAPASNQEGSF